MDPQTAQQRRIDCLPEATAVVRPKKPIAKKPKTEVVVQMGPFTDGSVSTPDTFENLSGPKELLVKPDTGEIGPFDPTKPVPENVIRKYITVTAQDNDVPNDLPRSGNSDYISRENPSIAYLEEDPSAKVVTRVEYVRESYSESTITQQDPPAQPQDDTPPCPPCECEEKPPCDEKPQVEPPPPTQAPPECEEKPPCEDKPPVCEEKPPCDDKPDCEEPPKPQDECDTPPQAQDDCATGSTCKPLTIDVLSNDSGCGPLCIKSATAEHGLVEIVDGKLVYTANEGFEGNDVINYSIADHNCLSDDACVFVSVTKGEACCDTPTTPPDEPCKDPEPACNTHESCTPCEEVASCDTPEPQGNNECSTEPAKDEYSSHDMGALKGEIFSKTEQLLDEIFSKKEAVLDKVDATKNAWSEFMDSGWSKAQVTAPAHDEVAAMPS